MGDLRFGSRREEGNILGFLYIYVTVCALSLSLVLRTIEVKERRVVCCGGGSFSLQLFNFLVGFLQKKLPPSPTFSAAKLRHKGLTLTFLTDESGHSGAGKGET